MRPHKKSSNQNNHSSRGKSQDRFPDIKNNAQRVTQSKEDTEYSIKSGFYVQVGSFKYEKNAETVAEKIREYKYQVNIYKGNSGDEIYYRVRVGPFDTKEDALNVLNKLRKNNFQGYVVRRK